MKNNIRSLIIAVIMVMFLATSCSNNTKAIVEQGMKALEEKDYETALQYFTDAAEEDPSKENLLALKMAKEFTGIAIGFDYYVKNKDSDLDVDSTEIKESKDRVENFKEEYKKYSELKIFKDLETDINAELLVSLDEEIELFIKYLIDDKDAAVSALDNYLSDNAKYLNEEQKAKLEDAKNTVKNSETQTETEGEEAMGDSFFTEEEKASGLADSVSKSNGASGTANLDYSQMTETQLARTFSQNDAYRIAEKVYGTAKINGGKISMYVDDSVPCISGERLFHDMTIIDPKTTNKTTKARVYDDGEIVELEVTTR